LTEFILALTTVPDESKGAEIARRLVEERLAACVTITTAGLSYYRWEGKICEDREFVLLIKSRSSLFDLLAARIKELHPYQVPELVALPIGDGSAEYLSWLGAETKDLKSP
jgi:periplasmic divalent cation tolerance protein